MGVLWCLIMVYIFIPWGLIMLGIFSCADLACEYPVIFYGIFHHDFCSCSSGTICIFLLLWEFLICPRYLTFVGYVFCKCFLSFWSLTFLPFDRVFPPPPPCPQPRFHPFSFTVFNFYFIFFLLKYSWSTKVFNVRLLQIVSFSF